LTERKKERRKERERKKEKGCVKRLEKARVNYKNPQAK